MTETSDLRVERCRRALNYLEPVTDTTVAQRVPAALDELEAGYTRPADRSAALRSVLRQTRARTAGSHQAPFHRFLAAMIEQRLNGLPHGRA